MIKPEDIEYHVPAGIGYQYAATIDLVACIPQQRILATFYTLPRKGLGG